MHGHLLAADTHTHGSADLFCMLFVAEQRCLTWARQVLQQNLPVGALGGTNSSTWYSTLHSPVAACLACLSP